MKLIFKYVIKNTDIKETEILKYIMWYSKKVYHILLHEIRENKREIAKVMDCEYKSTFIIKETGKEI